MIVPVLNDPILLLNREHDIIAQAEARLHNLDRLWESEPGAYKDEMTKLLTFFSEYADGYHHSKEEDVLFPALRNHPDFSLPELIDEFEAHHELFRTYTAEIREELENDNFGEAQHIMLRYIDELNDHIAAENEELFVMAENLLSKQDLETIFFRFVDLDMERGAIRKSELEEFVA